MCTQVPASAVGQKGFVVNNIVLLLAEVIGNIGDWGSKGLFFEKERFIF